MPPSRHPPGRAKGPTTSALGTTPRVIDIINWTLGQLPSGAPTFQSMTSAVRIRGGFEAVSLRRFAGEGSISVAESHARGRRAIAGAIGPAGTLRAPEIVDDIEALRSHILCPIFVSGAAWGYIAARQSPRSAVSTEDVRFLEVCAALATALAQYSILGEQARRISHEEWSLRGQGELLGVAESMLVTDDPTHLLQEIVDRLGAIVDVDTIDLALHYPQERVLRTIAAKGVQADVLAANPEVREDEGIMGWVFQHGRAELVNEPNTDKRLVTWAKLGRTAGALIAVPLADRGRVAGVLVLMRLRTKSAFSEDEYALVRKFADLASISLRNATVQKETATRATTDPLTGLRNRDTLIATLQREMRQDRLLSVLMLDLDHFKAVNDTFGHSAGDELLKAVAAVLRDHARNTDLTFRLGGDEFLVLLPGTDSAGALNLATRLLASVEGAATAALSEIGVATEISVTCSIGVSTYPLDAVDAEQLIIAADRAAYAAKRAGKNRARTGAQTRRETRAKRVDRRRDLVVAKCDAGASIRVV